MRNRAFLGLLLSLFPCSAQTTDRPSSIPWKRRRTTSAVEQSSTTATLPQIRKPATVANGASQNREQTGLAAYYSPQMDGQHTASGEPLNSQALTAAHPSYPLGTRVRVINLANGKSVIVQINDRSPSSLGRIITVTQRAAEELGFVKSGTARVRIQIVSDREQ